MFSKKKFIALQLSQCPVTISGPRGRVRVPVGGAGEALRALPHSRARGRRRRRVRRLRRRSSLGRRQPQVIRDARCSPGGCQDGNCRMNHNLVCIHLKSDIRKFACKTISQEPYQENYPVNGSHTRINRSLGPKRVLYPFFSVFPF